MSVAASLDSQETDVKPVRENSGLKGDYTFDYYLLKRTELLI